MDIPFPFNLVADGGVFWLFALGVVAVGYVAWRKHQRDRARREQLFVLAQQRGWRFAHRDPFGLLGRGFELLSRGDGRGIENVLHGDDGDDPVRVFDYWYYVQSTDAKGRTSRRYSRFTCALLPLDGVLAPHLRIERENVLSRLGDALGFRDQQFESAEFNRTFQVRCEDARFASTVIDPRMMRWLLDAGVRLTHVELHGAELLVATRRLEDPTECVGLHDLAKRLRERIPAVTASLYPGSARGGPEHLPG